MNPPKENTADQSNNEVVKILEDINKEEKEIRQLGNEVKLL